MAIHCVVYELRQDREEYLGFFRHLDEGQSVIISAHCRLVFSRNSAAGLHNYLQNFIYAGDTLLVVETTAEWAMNQGFEATEWLRELQHFDARQRGAGLDTLRRY